MKEYEEVGKLIDPEAAWKIWRDKQIFLSRLTDKQIFFSGYFAGASSAIEEFKRINDETKSSTIPKK